MTDTLRRAVLDVLEWLTAVSRQGLRPEAARRRLPDLQQRHTETRIELVWEEEAYDGYVHYDALLRVPEGGTVSLSYCTDRALPWPLRGVHRWSDADLARVNGRVLKVEHAIAYLDFVWEEARLVERLVNTCLVQEALEQDPIELSDAELQAAIDAFRRARRLHTAAETRCWMERSGITHEKLERLAESETLLVRLRERVTAGRVEATFAARQTEWDTARVARIDFRQEEAARQTAARVLRGEVTFCEAAQEQFLERAGSLAAPRPLFEMLRRGETAAPVAEAVFSAEPGEVAGPIPTENGFSLIHVLAVTPARLDERTRLGIQEVLFTEWLAERREAAVIEWCWGNARQTGGLAAVEP